MIVMVVDDSSFMRNSVKNCFAELQIPCIAIEATDGEDALVKLGDTKPELILLDWNMPKLLGIDFLKRVRADSRYKSLPIIMVTSESSRLNIIEALKSGATDYILKPITAKLLKEKLTYIFGAF
ncbi:MAG: response regulator [Treponema sp.]|nr:response regulator [Treponema sp.]